MGKSRGKVTDSIGVCYNGKKQTKRCCTAIGNRSTSDTKQLPANISDGEGKWSKQWVSRTISLRFPLPMNLNTEGEREPYLIAPILFRSILYSALRTRASGSDSNSINWSLIVISSSLEMKLNFFLFKNRKHRFCYLMYAPGRKLCPSFLFFYQQKSVCPSEKSLIHCQSSPTESVLPQINCHYISIHP